ncbi:hypothetical protein IEQ34_019354 [Dendrobium chrysotoxum]|uniref:Ubiquitin-like protease family profile domain-containing protein n=1 Tax=Dendrobium chrysotoxum TaxID=161865 RepID=A0AAV7FR11_DENCH|nr:hypothetical protein IEQ34_019354 [Dendrobium chrysotoxum]
MPSGIKLYRNDNRAVLRNLEIGTDYDSIRTVDFLLIPITHNNHWTLIVGNLIKKVLEFYDSLPKATHIALIPEVKHNRPLIMTSTSGRSERLLTRLSRQKVSTVKYLSVNIWKLSYKPRQLYGMRIKTGKITCLNSKLNSHSQSL